MIRQISLSRRINCLLVASSVAIIVSLSVSKAIGQTLNPWATEHFRVALTAQRDGKLDVAAKEYRLIISRDPRFAGAYLNLGIVYHQQRNYSKAVATLKKAAALNPKLVGAETFLGVDEYLSEDFGSAVEHLSHALQLEPRDRVAGTYLGLSYIALDEPLEAIRVLRAMVQYYPEAPDIHYQLGEAYLSAMKQALVHLKRMGGQSAFYHWALAVAAERKNDEVSMIEEYMRALSCDPNLGPLYLKLAAALREAGLQDLATAALRRYRILNPARNITDIGANGEAHRSRSNEAVLLQNAVAFQRLWNAIPPIHPDSSMPQVGDEHVEHALQKGLLSPRGKILGAVLHFYFEGNYDAVINTIVSSKLYETNWGVAYILAAVYQEQVHYKRAYHVVEENLLPYLKTPAVSLLAMDVESHLALQYLNQAIAMQPDSYLSKYLEARYYAAAGQDQKALATYHEALKLDPHHLGIHFAIGELYEDELHWKLAAAEYRAELALDPANEMALAHLGHSLTEARQADEAIPVLEQLLRANPTDGEAYADLGKAWDIKGQKDKAIEAFNRALLYIPNQASLHYGLFRLYREIGDKDRALKELAAFKTAESQRKKVYQENLSTLESGQQ